MSDYTWRHVEKWTQILLPVLLAAGGHAFLILNRLSEIEKTIAVGSARFEAIIIQAAQIQQDLAKLSDRLVVVERVSFSLEEARKQADRNRS